MRRYAGTLQAKFTDIVGVLAELLRGDPAYDEQLAERVLSEYVRIHHHSVQALISMGMPYEDVEQELRIKLWYHWERYKPGKVRLQQWLSWRMRHTIKNLFRKANKEHRIVCVPIDSERL